MSDIGRFREKVALWFLCAASACAFHTEALAAQPATNQVEPPCIQGWPSKAFKTEWLWKDVDAIRKGLGIPYSVNDAAEPGSKMWLYHLPYDTRAPCVYDEDSGVILKSVMIIIGAGGYVEKVELYSQ